MCPARAAPRKSTNVKYLPRVLERHGPVRQQHPEFIDVGIAIERVIYRREYALPIHLEAFARLSDIRVIDWHLIDSKKTLGETFRIKQKEKKKLR